MFARKYLVLILSLSFVFSTGCSGGGGTPIYPTDNPEIPGIEIAGDTQHRLWGLWDIHIDLQELTAEVRPLREMQGHIDITFMLQPPYCPDCVVIDVISFDTVTRILEADVTLRNPTGLTVYDVRGILFTDDYGHRLVNADDWTGLWDIPGGMDINPFKAYVKEDDYRKFKGYESHTEKFLVYIPKPPHFLDISYAVDVSFPDMCREPYEITGFWNGTLYPDVGSSAAAFVGVLDHGWDINEVSLFIPEVTGVEYIECTEYSNQKWTAQITNEEGVGPGEYEVLISARSEDSGDLALYDFGTVIVMEPVPPLNPVDVTPPWLNITPYFVSVSDGYAFVSGMHNGLHIFDVSDPENPEWIHKAAGLGFVGDLAVENGFAYVPQGQDGLYILDVVPPESTNIVNIVDLPGGAGWIEIKDGIAYVTNSTEDLLILEMSSPESPTVVNSVDIPSEKLRWLTVDGGYAYILSDETVFTDEIVYIVDVVPYETAQLVGSFAVDDCYSFEAYGGYLFCACQYNVQVFDVDPPDDVQLCKEIEVDASYIGIRGGMAYASGYYLSIIDIDPVESAQVVGLIDAGGSGRIHVGDGMVYLAANDSLRIVDVDPPETAQLSSVFYSTPYNPVKTCSDGNTACVVGEYGNNLYLIDVNPPESSKTLERIHAYDYYLVDIRDVLVDGHFLYLLRTKNGIFDILEIYDIDPVESIQEVGEVEFCPPISSLDVEGGYAFITGPAVGFSIVDVDPPETASVVNVLYYIGFPNDVDVVDGYAYVTSSEGFFVVDIDPVESAHVVKEIAGQYCKYITVNGDYAYYRDYYGGNLCIVDISDPESAYIVSSIYAPSGPIAVESGYALIASKEAGLLVYDVDPPESVHYAMTIDTIASPRDVALNNGYAIVATYDSVIYPSGVQVFKLW